MGPRRVSLDVLLLPGRLLQGLLGGPPFVRGGRAAKEVPWRELAAFDPSKCPPLLPLPRAGLLAVPLPRRVEVALVHRRCNRPGALWPSSRHDRPGGQCLPAGWLRLGLPLASTPGRGMPRPALPRARAPKSLRLRELPQPQAHALGVDEPFFRRFCRRLRAALLHGRLAGLENLLMAQYEEHAHDVLVVGAGGAGLRAAIEASRFGVSVGMVTKSLLGKAHTVMAEGGIAAALANVDERDSWKVHFADTLRGGQYLNNPRMAELHARESPDRVRELEAWGALFDRTQDGRILQRNFGGHKYPRLAHVGDRTGLEMIRTLQDHGVHCGIDVHMECTVLTLLKDGERVVGAFGYEREKGVLKLFRAKAIVLATGGIGRAYKVTSNSWEYT